MCVNAHLVACTHRCLIVHQVHLLMVVVMLLLGCVEKDFEYEFGSAKISRGGEGGGREDTSPTTITLAG